MCSQAKSAPDPTTAVILSETSVNRQVRFVTKVTFIRRQIRRLLDVKLTVQWGRQVRCLAGVRDEGDLGFRIFAYELELGPFFLPKVSTTFTNLVMIKVGLK